MKTIVVRLDTVQSLQLCQILTKLTCAEKKNLLISKEKKKSFKNILQDNSESMFFSLEVFYSSALRLSRAAWKNSLTVVEKQFILLEQCRE